MKQHTRRTLLRRGGIGLAGVMSASAGCLKDIPLIGSGSSSYRDWLYAPQQDRSLDPYPVTVIKPSSIQQHSSHFSDSFRDHFSHLQKMTDAIQINSSETIIRVGVSSVILGDFSKSEVVSSLQGIGWREKETYHGHTLLKRDQPPFVVGVSNQSIVQGIPSWDNTSQMITKAFIDTERGAVDGYTDQHKSFEILTKLLDSGDVIWSGKSPTIGTDYYPYGKVNGGSLRMNGETSQLTLAFVFESNDSMDEKVVKQQIRTTSYAKASENISFTRDGRGLVAEMKIKTADFE